MASDKSFVRLLLFSFVQCLIAIIAMLVLSPYVSERSSFIFNLLFYLLIFIFPIFFYIFTKFKENVFSFLGLQENAGSGVLYGLVISVFIVLVFLIKNQFAFSLKADSFFLIIGPALAGIFEEIPFRGFYLKEFVKKLGFWKANLLASFLFSTLHLASILQGNLFQILFFFVLSLWLGYLHEKSKSLWAPIFVHVTFNIMTTLF